MGVMESLRASTKYLFWVLLFSFGVLWMLSDTQFFDALVSGPRSLGSVNGDAIGFDEYNQRLQYYTQQYSQQTGRTISPEVRANYESQVWDELVNIRLMEQKMDDLGITVTDEEVVEMITGDNPAPIIRQIFTGENGQLDRNQLNAAIESPESTQQWIMIENQIRQERRQQKLNNYLTAGNVVSERDIQTEYLRTNSSASVRFVRYPYANVAQEDITVSDSDIESYYNENKEDYKREASYELSYVIFSKAATAKDTLRTREEVADLREDFAAASNDSTFLIRYQSETQFNNAFVELDEIRDEFKMVTDLENGEVSEPIQIGDRFHLIKRIDRDGNTYKFANFSQRVVADPIETIDQMAEEADDFSFYAEEDGFEQEAERRGLQILKATATKGTPYIPGLGNARQVLTFAENRTTGDVSKALELDPYFVVAKLEKINPEGYRPLDEVRSPIETRVSIEKRKAVAMQRLNDTNAASLEEYASAHELKVDTAQTVLMSSTVIPGAGREIELIGKIFSMEEGSLSSPIAGENGAYVLYIDEINMANAENITESTKQQLRQRIRQSKSQAFFASWMATIKEEADIVDNRKLLLQN